MDTLAKRLRERAEQLGISNSEAARRAGLEERRYGHYIRGRNEPDLATLVRIATELGTTPNWLLGVEEPLSDAPEKAELLARFKNAASVMNANQLELCVIQAEAVAARKRES
jgi:transcriptional regulator with XRE-family HTH domain